MKIVIDQAIPFIRGVFENYARVLYRDGAAISPADIKDADALVIRTRTRCNASLLDKSRVKIISAASIGKPPGCNLNQSILITFFILHTRTYDVKPALNFFHDIQKG